VTTTKVIKNENSFGDRLRTLRGDLSLMEFSKKIGVTQSSYHNWERGLKEPSYSVIKPICKICNCSPLWLLGIEEKTAAITKGIDLNHKIDLLKKNATEASTCINRLLKDIQKLEGAL